MAGFTLHSALRSSLLRLAAGVLALFGVGALTCPGLAQQANPEFPVTNNQVLTTALHGNTLYIGGYFDAVGRYTGPYVAFDAGTGSLTATSPRVNGISASVRTIAPDGEGGFYLGGEFTSVNGVPRSNLAHVRADGTLDGWAPSPDGTVWSLALDGSKLYVGGSFYNIGGQGRWGLAAIDRTTGLASGWDPHSSFGGISGTVYGLAVSGSTVYAGGGFNNIGGQSRSGLAALDAATGLAAAWNPNPLDTGFPGVVRSIQVSGSTVYVSGSFTTIGGSLRNSVAAIDAGSAAATAWNPTSNGLVYQLLLNGSMIYACGSFTSIGGAPRKSIAELNLAGTGNATSWNPDASSTVFAIARTGSTVYAGGNFELIGGASRARVAALDATTGLATGWDPPDPGYDVYSVLPSGSTVVVGGTFWGIDVKLRSHLAAIDLTTNRVTDWNPNPDLSYVNIVAASGSKVFVGGHFNNIGGQARSYLAAIDSASGLATPWNPSPNSFVNAIVPAGGVLYVGGSFTSTGGQPRNRIAAFDEASGILTAWNPSATGAVNAIAVSGNTVFAGGLFQTSIGGQSRSRIAALDATTGLATAWNPGANGEVLALAVDGPTLYAGGAFTSVAGQPRGYVAAIDSASATVTAWNPGADNRVGALALAGSTVYAGGAFGTIGGQTRSRVAALDGAGLATAWDPNAESSVSALSTDGSNVYVAGYFLNVGNQPRQALAALGAANPTPLTATVLAANGGESLVIGSPTTVRWSAAGDHGVLSVDLYVSRTGASGPWELIAAGVPNTGSYGWTITGPAVANDAYLRVDARGADGGIVSDASNGAFSIVTSVSAVPGGALTFFALAPIVPTPARGRAALTFVVPRRAPVEITMFDLQGREVAVLVDRFFEAGAHTRTFDTSHLDTGVYFVRLRAPGVDLRQRLVVLH